ncbi:hypothetical protein [Pseudomonas bharatica]|uniref:hypothetical protein n=1 Tax=Pseudomonas bharatica TaxID=2692112 RepID=UPI003B287B9B
MASDLSVEEIYSIVSRLYDEAIRQLHLRPEQAFAYVQDEAGSICPSGDVGINVVLQTAIFREGMRYGLELSRASPYAEDMLEALSKLYEECDVDDLVGVGLQREQLREVLDSMAKVKRKYLFLG